ncbi:putative Ig domain-containing protein [Nocardioides mangrovi]|uniref:Lamin tail domain-containing protein n=1 Tax=Nocardioides mangrovi TaxID=2874580 RepID=A0ABS7UB85_9ACTN|nr:putative Ig domain-containing protein [Nocardioides mangrovi]MBZ5737953.1 lamin tail domain-containing protein [Nocardioides mangrovi]
MTILKSWRGLVAALLTAGLTATMTASLTAAPAEAATTPDHLVISAVFGSDGGAYTSDWVQLYNPTDSDISLGTISGSTVTPSYYQCYRSLAGTSCSSMKLYGTVLAHHYFLIWDGHNAAAGTDRGTPPAGVRPDLNFALDAGNTAGTSSDPSGQSNTGFGGYSTGGQILLLSAATGGVYTGSGDLSSSAARTAGVVDAVAWTKYASPSYTQPGSAETGGVATITGASAGTSNASVSVRTFTDGVPVDTDKNAADFTPLTTADFTLRSQASSRVAVADVADTEISRGEAMAPIQVQGSKGVGSLSYAASGLPAGVDIDAGTGVISGTPAASDDLGDYPVTVTVSDQTPSQADTATTTFTLSLSSTLRVDQQDTVTARKGMAITPIEVTAHGGTPDYAFAATGLPAGLAIDPATGVISGTPADAVGRYSVHVTVSDSGVGGAHQSTGMDFTVVERPRTTAPSGTDPLAGLRINEVTATGTAVDDWVELVNIGGALTGASVSLVDADGDAYRLPTRDIAAGAYVVVDGTDLATAGLDLAATDTLDLTTSDDTVLDETSWTSYPSTSWARYPDGTGDFAVSKRVTRGATNALPAVYATDDLVIAAVFGANSDTVRWSNDWVELYNPTDHPISLGTIDPTTTPNATVTPAYALCYRSYSATGACSSLVKLYGTVAPHHYFFVWYKNAHTPADQGTYPAGFTPDLDMSVATAANGNQGGSNMGGCNTGGQIELLDATRGTSPINGDLSSSAAKSAGAVDAVGWMNASTNQPTAAESKGSATVAGLDSGTNNACVIARKFARGYAIDSDANNADFTTVADLDSFAAHSQHDDRVAITPVGDAEVSISAEMNPIQVQASAVYGALSYAASGLPDGVSIDPATGVISGTPSATDALGDYDVTVTVSDDVPSDTATTSFVLTLSKVLRLDPVADVSVHQGTAITDIQLTGHGGHPGYSYTASGLPAGITLNRSTGVISGTPTGAIGRSRVRVTVIDSGVASEHATVSREFAIVVLPSTSGPQPGDPLAGLTINEVRVGDTPAQSWVEVYNTGAAITDAVLVLEDSAGDTVRLPARDVAAHGFTVVDGADLAAADVDLAAAADTLYLTESDDTLLDQTSWSSAAPTSWARYPDGSGDFAVSAYATKGAANSGTPEIGPNDLLVTEVNYDNNSTDYYEYSEVTNTTDHPIDFAAYGLTMTKSGAVMTFHDPSDTSQSSPTVDPVIPAHGTQVFWWVENQYFGVKTTTQFRSNYGIPASTPVVLVYGFTSMANSGGDHSYYISVNQGSTLVSRAWVDTPCAANTLNGSVVCTATNGNYAEHYAVPADRGNADAAVWYNSLYAGGDSVAHPLKKSLSSPSTIDLEQLGFTRAIKITETSAVAVTLTNTASSTVDASGYVLEDKAGARYQLPSGTTLAAGAHLALPSGTTGFTLAASDWVTLLAPQGYAYTDGAGIVDTTGPLLTAVPYDSSTGGDPVIDETTGLPLPPAGGLYRPGGISAADGTVYVSNTGDNVLAAITGGETSTVAGSLTGYGDLGDEGPAEDAQLYQPGGTAVDDAGNVYIADSGDNVIRRVTTDGVIHRFAGTGVAGGAGAAVTEASTPLSVNLWHPNGVAVDSAGNVLIADTYDNRVLEVTAGGAITVVAGTGRAGYTGDGTAGPTARLSQPTGVAVDHQDNVYIADASNNVVRRVDAASGVITTVAGDFAAGQTQNECLGGYSGDGGPATSAQLNTPQAIALDRAGDLFIADTFNHAIRQVSADGTISTLVNTSAVSGTENISPVGGGSFPWSTHLNTPSAVAVDRSTNVLYIADTKNNAVAQVVHAAFDGNAAGPTEPADQVAITGSGLSAGACAELANGPVVSVSAPSISGGLDVGSVLTADPGSWTPTPDRFAYQWLRNGVPIGGATAATYTTTTADGGRVVSVAVTAVKEGFAPASATSPGVSIVRDPGDPGDPGQTLSTRVPTLSGSFTVDRTVRADPGTWRAGTATVTSFDYQWLRNGVPITGATSPAYTLTAADARTTVSVRVTGSFPSYPSASVVSRSHVVSPAALTHGKPKVRGKARVGRTLTASPSTWRAGTVRLGASHLDYQWYADGRRIAGATRATLAITRTFRHDRIAVEVTGRYPGYRTASATSRVTHAVRAR